MKLKCKINAEVTLTATAEVVIDVPDEYKTEGAAAIWVEDNLVEVLNQMDKAYEEAYSAYVRSNYALERPKQVYWDVDSSDVYNNVVNSRAELEEWEVVK